MKFYIYGATANELHKLTNIPLPKNSVDTMVIIKFHCIKDQGFPCYFLQKIFQKSKRQRIKYFKLLSKQLQDNNQISN